MIRIFFKLCFWVIIARWTYAEVQLVAPSATPAIDFALQKIQIPTHDKWSKGSFNQWLSQAKHDGRASALAMQASMKDTASSALQRVQEFSGVPSAEAKSLSHWVKDSEAFTKF